MPEKSAGAAPQEGFQYQRRAAAYFFLTGDIIDFSGIIEKLYIEKHHADFSFIIEQDERFKKHFFESKYKTTGELKWNTFKESVFPEFYRISEKHSDSANKNRTYFHLVTNGSVADSIADLAEDAELMRHGTPWGTFESIHGREVIDKLKSGIESNEVVQNDESVDMPEDRDDLHTPLWGLVINTPTLEEVEAKIENYLRDCSPGNFTRPKLRILEEIQKEGSLLVKRRDLQDKIDIQLNKLSQTTTPSNNKTFGDLKGELNVMSDEFNSSSPRTPKIKQNREDVREFSERLNKLPNTDETTVESASEILDDQLSKLEEIEKDKYETEAQISAQLDLLLDQADNRAND